MKKSFVSSLIFSNGIVGGGVYIEDTVIIFKTNKLTVDKKFKNLTLDINEIESLTWQWIIFPIATFIMKNGEKYKFIIFNKSRFQKWYSCIVKNN